VGGRRPQLAATQQLSKALGVNACPLTVYVDFRTWRVKPTQLFLDGMSQIDPLQRSHTRIIEELGGELAMPREALQMLGLPY
jgi:hypothetical protein